MAIYGNPGPRRPSGRDDGTSQPLTEAFSSGSHMEAQNVRIYKFWESTRRPRIDYPPTESVGTIISENVRRTT